MNATRWIISVAISFFLLIAISFIFPHHERADGDIIAILSLLVTVLMGWNIYTVIDINRRLSVSEINARKDFMDVANKAKGNAIGVAFAYMGNLYAEKKEYILCFQLFMDALNAFLEGDREYEEVEDAIRLSLENVKNISNDEELKIKIKEKYAQHIATFIETLSQYKEEYAKQTITNLLT